MAKDNDLFCPPLVSPAINRHVMLHTRLPKIEDLVTAGGRMSPERRCEDAFDIRAVFTRELHRGRDRPTSQWHLDEMAVTLASRQFWLWRAADGEGEVLDLCSNDAGTQTGSEDAVTRTQIGRAQSGGPSSGFGSGGGFPCPEYFVSYDAERVAACEMTLGVGEDRGVNQLEALG